MNTKTELNLHQNCTKLYWIYRDQIYCKSTKTQLLKRSAFNITQWFRNLLLSESSEGKIRISNNIRIHIFDWLAHLCFLHAKGVKTDQKRNTVTRKISPENYIKHKRTTAQRNTLILQIFITFTIIESNEFVSFLFKNISSIQKMLKQNML